MSHRRKRYREYLLSGTSAKISRQTVHNQKKLVENSEGFAQESSADAAEYIPSDISNSDSDSAPDCHIAASDSRGSPSPVQEIYISDEDREDIILNDAYEKENLDKDLHPSLGNVSKFDCILMIFHLVLRHGLTFTALQDILKFINVLFGEKIIPESLYLMDKIFKSDLKPVFHFYCSKCLASVDKPSDQTIQHIPCVICGTVCNFKTMNNGHFFLSLPIKEQIISLLESKDNILDLLAYGRQNVNIGKYCDVFDGFGYKRLVSGDILADKNNLSLTLNTDGSPVFKSVKNTMWPIQFRINELPPWERFEAQNLMLAGIWFGKTEPNMSLFLRPFLKEACDMYNDGFTWKHRSGKQIASKVVLLNCVLDSVAKPNVQSTTQFNGYYGCGYCYHPGTPVISNGRQQIRYSPSEIYPERTNAEIRSDMSIVDGKSIHGVKGKSPLIVFPQFNLVFGFVIDYMHAVLLGVSKLTANLWLDSKYHSEEFYIGRQTREIDTRLLSIKPPQCISRRPRSIEERVHWKANEWRSWLLYYSLPCLINVLPKKFVKHHCLLVTSIFIMLKDDISEEEQNEASVYLTQYVIDFETLYGSINMKFNVHLLLHLYTNVKLWGPLWCYSAFSFEAGNGSLVKLVKGTRGVATQIAQKYLMFKSVPRLMSMYNVRKNAFDFCSELMSYNYIKSASQCNETVLLDDPVSFPFTREQRALLLQKGISFSEFCFNRMVHKNRKYHSKTYRKCKKSDDSGVKLIDSSFGIIERIMTAEINCVKEVFIIVRSLNVNKNASIIQCSSGAKASHIKLCNSYAFGDLDLVKVDCIMGKSILVDLQGCTYVINFPNFHEKD